MSQNNYDVQCLCKKCYIRLVKPNKKEIRNMVMTDYTDECDNCHRNTELVDYIEDGD